MQGGCPDSLTLLMIASPKSVHLAHLHISQTAYASSKSSHQLDTDYVRIPASASIFCFELCVSIILLSFCKKNQSDASQRGDTLGKSQDNEFQLAHVCFALLLQNKLKQEFPEGGH
jgi:hypothetical protein